MEAGMAEVVLSADARVEDVLKGRPELIPVFLRRRMACVGCVMAPFMTLEEAARAYRLPLDEFLRELNREPPDGSKATGPESGRDPD
jgi:hybrid cluster-associated redox disulfide protein